MASNDVSELRHFSYRLLLSKIIMSVHAEKNPVHIHLKKTQLHVRCLDDSYTGQCAALFPLPFDTVKIKLNFKRKIQN